MFTIKRRLLAVAAVAALALVQVVPALAGSNGQQIRLWEDPTVGYVTVTGLNQNDSYATWWSGYTPNPGSYWYYMSGAWWKGTVQIAIWWPDGSYYGINSSCTVPVSQSGDWYTCYVPY